MKTRTALIALLVAVGTLTSGCKDQVDEALAQAIADENRAKKGGSGGATEHSGGADDDAASLTQNALAAAKKAGLAQGAFEKTAARPYGASSCERGEIAKLDVLICRYGGADDAKGAKNKLQAFVGTATTGALRLRGVLALVVADRAKVDLKGKGINKLLKAFGGEG